MSRLAAGHWRQWALLALAIACAQALYWLVLDDRVFRAEPSSEIVAIEMQRFEVARLASPSTTALANARFVPADPVFTHCCDTASFAARMHFALNKVPDTGLGIISTLQVDNYLLLVNGSLIVGEGEMMPGRQSFHGQKTFITRIPAGLLRAGGNQLTYITVRDGFPYTDIYPPIVAEFDSLDRFAARRLWVMGVFPLYGGLLLAALGMVAAVMTMRDADRRFGVWLSLLCTAFAANALYGVVLDPPFGGYGRMLAFFAINLAVPTAILGFIEAWSGQANRWLLRGALPAYGAVLAVIAAMLALLPMPDGYDLPAQLCSWYHIVVAAASFSRLVWHLARMRDARIIEGAILSVLAATSLIDGLSLHFPGEQWMEGNLAHAAPFLMVAMVVAYVARNIRLFQSQAAIAGMLREQVAQREAELAEAYAREQVLARAAAHDDERRRIMRDLHDGMGGQLMSLLMSARLGEAEPEQMAASLQAVIDEMRIMVDSMDSVGDNLASALETFRKRIGPRLADAGVALEWEGTGVGQDFAYGPREVLQVFRVMQEAVGNALRHAGARRLRISVEDRRETGEVAIIIADDGRGMVHEGMVDSTGKGIANMRRRTDAIGGSLQIGPAAGGGTAVTLVLRGQRAAEGAPT